MTVRKCLVGLLVGFICCNICVSNVHAAWSTNPAINNAISLAGYGQVDPAITSDGSGGAIITWNDSRSGSAPAIYAQRIDASGVVKWTADGVAICTAANSPRDPAITSDGSGGAIITWENGSVNSDVYAQRIDASGAVQWAVNGVAICTAANYQYSPKIISDGSHGAIITWSDSRGTDEDIYAQRIDASGVVQWAVNGVEISTALGTQNVPVPISDGSGGAIITWQDSRSGVYTHIYAQRINASGVVQWTANGVAICTAAEDKYSPRIATDGSSGAIITWIDYRVDGSTYDIYAQRINSSGTVQWTVNGVIICNADDNQDDPAITNDGRNGAIITWKDYRSVGNPDIYAQRVNSSGGILWTGNGVAICTAAGYQEMPTIITDGSHGAIITWYDFRISGNYDIYAQRINANGALQWIADGVAICTALNNQYYPVMASDGKGGSIITWYDDRRDGDSTYDIYAQVVNASGALQPGVAASIPTLNEWGMILFMLLMGATAIFFLKRMKAGARLGHP